MFYGPPGAGKSYEARAAADRFVRQGVLRAWGPKRYFSDVAAVDSLVSQRVRRIQFHPGYSYEDLVRGLQLVHGGGMEYRDGVLLQIIADLQKAPEELREMPFVLILDEMNRADLSKVLGECFSLLEDRDVPVQLAGQDQEPRQVCVPPNPYFVGTMNLIDQSLEQIDFALRRRFLWFFRGFDRQQFIEICKHRWGGFKQQKRIGKGWDRFDAEFEVLADRAAAINAEIERHPSLGAQYQIGHTYFSDVVHFVERHLTASPRGQSVLWNRKNEGLDPTIGTLWTYSLKPLLEQYLSGVDDAERQAFLGRVERLLMRGVAQ